MSRLLVSAATVAVLIAGTGTAWERFRFGSSPEGLRDRLATEVELRLEDAAARLRAAVDATRREAALIEAATTDRNQIPALFGHLAESRLPTAPPYALTVYVPDAAGEYTVLAWSDGPAEDLDLHALAPSADVRTVVLGSTLGLRLLALATISSGDHTLGVITAERILTVGQSARFNHAYHRFSTSLGEVEIAPAEDADPGTTGLVVSTRAGVPLVDVRFDPAVIEQSREVFRTRARALALIPLLLLAAVVAGRPVLRRRDTATAGRFLLHSLVLSGIVALTGGALWALARAAAMPHAVDHALLAVTALCAAAALPVSVWWRALARRTARTQPVRAALELAVSGMLAAAVLAGTAGAVDVVLRESGGGSDSLTHATRLLMAMAALWSITTMHATVIERWRIRWFHPGPATLAIALAVTPSAALGLVSWWAAPAATIAPVGLAVAAAAAVAALAAAPLKHLYRRGSQSTRLLLLFAATVLPALALDPLATASAQRALEAEIERVHAPAMLGHAERLLDELSQATTEIDAMPNLAALVARPPDATGVSTDAAFEVWSGTGLSRARLTSSVELFDTDGGLSSRFALNVPELGIDQSSANIGCSWEVYGEVGTFGAEELRMLHAERGVCDAAGTGAIVLHVVFDYRALPFLSARNPYDDARRQPARADEGAAAPLEVVVYGWSRLPIFVTGATAWSIDPVLLTRLEQSRTPFWTTRLTDAGPRRIYFLNDRAGIYAIGFPLPSLFERLTRLADTAAAAAILFVLLLGSVTLLAPLLNRRQAPIRAVIVEVRTSFYRKLFLFFVLTAAIPVAVLALTFSAYMGEQLRSDVETEAINAATIARRVLEDTIALQQVPLTDDVLVWIGRVINQDVNLYDGPRVRATSQRDLFDSGILAERTPARAYRAVALDRVPTFVEEQQAGTLTYLIAAAPVPGLGRHAMITVPLAPRQQEIEREIADLNRGVLFGAVCVVLLAAGLGAWVAQRVADPVARLTRATRQITSGQLDVRIVADTADELRRLVDDFNSMTATLRAQREELGRTHELKAWADISRQVAHDIKNPLTPIQLAAEHAQRVHEDRGRPLGATFDQCIDTILGQVKLLRQIATEFSSFATSPTPRLSIVDTAELLDEVIRPYHAGLQPNTRIEVDATGAPPVIADRTLVSRALTNLVENALQAMPEGGRLRLRAGAVGTSVEIACEDDGIGMTADALARAFEPHFSTKTGGTGLGLANARRNIESCGGTLTARSAPGRGTTMTVTLPGARPDGSATG